MQQIQVGATEPLFDDEAQQEIISLAAQLQRQAGQSMSLTELERIAMEAGIEPHFVREAALLRAGAKRHPRLEQPMSLPVTIAALGALALVVLQAAFAWITVDVGSAPPAFFFAGVLSVALGLAARSYGKNARFVGLIPVVSTLIVFAVLALNGSALLGTSRVYLVGPLVLWQVAVALLTLALSNIRLEIVRRNEPAAHR